jgi:hypothetical protein
LGCPIANLHSARGAPPRGSPKDFGTPVAKIDSPRGESIIPRYALRSDQLRKKAASLSLPQMALRLSGIKFLPPVRTYSSLQIGKFPFAYRGLKSAIAHKLVRQIFGVIKSGTALSKEYA